MLGERRELIRWPHVRHLEGGRIGIYGRVLTVGRYLVVTQVLRRLVMVGALLLLILATQGMWHMKIPGGTLAFACSQKLLAIHLWLHELSQAYPAVASNLAYKSGRPFDWHLGVIALLLVLLGRVIESVGGILLTPRMRFTCTISPDLVVIRRSMRTFRFSRADLARPVAIRAVAPEAWHAKRSVAMLSATSLLGEFNHPPGIIEVVQGPERRRILFAVRADRAEAIAAQCGEALRATSDLVNTSRRSVRLD